MRRYPEDEPHRVARRHRRRVDPQDHQRGEANEEDRHEARDEVDDGVAVNGDLDDAARGHQHAILVDKRARGDRPALDVRAQHPWATLEREQVTDW